MGVAPPTRNIAGVSRGRRAPLGRTTMGAWSLGRTASAAGGWVHAVGDAQRVPLLAGGLSGHFRHGAQPGLFEMVITSRRRPSSIVGTGRLQGPLCLVLTE